MTPPRLGNRLRVGMPSNQVDQPTGIGTRTLLSDNSADSQPDAEYAALVEGLLVVHFAVMPPKQLLWQKLDCYRSLRHSLKHWLLHNLSEASCSSPPR